jgi:hypothetical protein
MTDDFPRNSPNITLAERIMARPAVIMNDSKIPVPATPASLGVEAGALLQFAAGSIMGMAMYAQENTNKEKVGRTIACLSAVPGRATRE